METPKGFALVTGASSGIGMEMARELARHGYPLVLASRNLQKLEEFARELSSAYSVKVECIQSDLSRPGAAAKLHQDCIDRKLDIAYLLNNAGVGLFGTVLDQSVESLTSMVHLNVTSLAELSALFARDMAAKGFGRILNTGSMVGAMAVPYFAGYSSSKSFVNNFSIALRAEMKPHGVRVTCLMPGFVKTGFDQAAGAGETKYGKVSAMSGMTPDKVARCGVKAMLKGKAKAVPGIGNRISLALVGLIPKKWIAGIAYTFIKRLAK